MRPAWSGFRSRTGRWASSARSPTPTGTTYRSSSGRSTPETRRLHAPRQEERVQMSTQQTAVSPGRANLALATLFLGMFVTVSGELLVVGVLDRIAADLHVTIRAAGTLVTAYALGLAIGGPILTALTIKLEKKTVLIGMLVLFIVCNLFAVLTHSYGVFL